MKELPSHNERTSVKTHVCVNSLQICNWNLMKWIWITFSTSTFQSISSANQVKSNGRFFLFCFFVLCFVFVFFFFLFIFRNHIVTAWSGSGTTICIPVAFSQSMALASYWEEAFVAKVATQCCWKLGDTDELQPSLWCCSFTELLVSLSTIQEESFPMTPRQPVLAQHIRSSMIPLVCSARSLLRFSWVSSGAWPCRTAAIWFRRSVKNSETPS